MQTPEYRFANSTENLRERVIKAGNVMTGLLEEVLVASTNQVEEEAATDLIRTIARYLDQIRPGDTSEFEDDEVGDDSMELLE